MTMTIDIGQVLTAVALSLVAFQARQVLAEIKSIRIDLTHLQHWAARKHGYEPREE